MKKLKTNLCLIFTALSIGHSAPASADASATLDSLVAGATFNYTGGDHRKLDQIGRHAVSFGRLRYFNPTNPVNVVNLTPPSIGAPNCSSININLGAFDIISLDEAVAILRRVANEALTYGFGLALQSMCSPCWSGMQTLRDQLNRFNQSNRNSCQIMKNMVDNVTDKGGVFKLHDKLCDSGSLASGDDSYLCKLADGTKPDPISDGINTLYNWLDALGEDKSAVFTLGNVLKWGFDTISAGGAMPQNVFSQDLTRLILGVPDTEQPKQYQMAEAAMNFFGYYIIGSDDDTDGNPGESTIKSGYIDPPITTLSKIVTDPIDCSASSSCSKIFVCKDATINGTTYQCMSHTDVEKNFQAVITEYRQAHTNGNCADEATNPTLIDVLNCEVQATFTKLIDTGDLNLSPLQRNIVQASPPAVVRAFALGKDHEKNILESALADSLGRFLTYDLVATYVSDLASFTSASLTLIERETEVDPQKLDEIKDAIKDKLEQNEKIRDKARDALNELKKHTEFQNVLAEYQNSLSNQVTTIINKP